MRDLAHKLGEKFLTEDAREQEDETARRMFVLQYVQPGLVGLMDGSVSTLAPLFAAAFATHSTWETFLVGLAASVGAGISMGFAEALSDDGSLTGRGTPWMRGTVCGMMTTHRRARPHAALPHSGFLDRDRRGDHRGRDRTRRRSPISATATWTRRSSRRRSRSWSAACWCFSPGILIGQLVRCTHRMFTLAHLSTRISAPLPSRASSNCSASAAIGYLNWRRKRGAFMHGATVLAPHRRRPEGAGATTTSRSPATSSTFHCRANMPARRDLAGIAWPAAGRHARSRQP